MKVNVEEVAPCRKKLDVELTTEEVNEVFEKSFGDVVRYAQLPGFRKGHVPKKMLERKFGDSIKEEAKNQLFQKGFLGALKEKNLSPLGDPDMDFNTLKAEKGKPFTFSAEVDVRPEFELADYKGIKLVEKTEAVTDEEISGRLEMLRMRFADHVEKEGEAEKENLVEGNVTFTIDGEEIFKDQERAIKVTGTTMFGLEIGDLEKHFKGTKKGDQKEIKFVTPDTYPKEELRGKDAIVVMDVTKILEEKLPELDDEFAKRIGIDNMEALSSQIKESIEMERKNAAKQETEKQLIDALIEANKFSLPEGLVERQANANMQQNQMRMMMMGMAQENIEQSQDERMEESRKLADEQIRRMIIFDAIGEKENITVSEADFNMHIARLAQAYNRSPEKMLREIQQQNGMYSVQHEIRDIKITQFLLENAEVTEEKTEAKSADK